MKVYFMYSETVIHNFRQFWQCVKKNFFWQLPNIIGDVLRSIFLDLAQVPQRWTVAKMTKKCILEQ